MESLFIINDYFPDVTKEDKMDADLDCYGGHNPYLLWRILINHKTN